MDGVDAKRGLSIEQWHEQTSGGRFLPLHIPIHGVSMFPLVRYMRDPVTIVPLKERPVVGDVVLFHDSIGGRYVLHRVIEIDGERVLTRGDNCIGPDRWMTMEDVWGKAVLIERGRLEIRPDPKKGLRHARCWYRVGKVYRFVTRLLRAVGRRIKRMIRGRN